MGPCTANARRPTVDSRCHATTIICCVADLRHCLPTTSVTGVQQSTRYCRALPCQHLNAYDTMLVITTGLPETRMSETGGKSYGIRSLELRKNLRGLTTNQQM